MRKRNQIHPSNGGDVSDHVTIDDLVYKKNHLALNLTEEIQQLMPETITHLNFNNFTPNWNGKVADTQQALADMIENHEKRWL